MRSHRGFTLLEVLVALAVLSVALLAGVRAADALTHRAQLHEREVAAHLCAHNALVALRLRGTLPDVGGADSTCTQGPFEFALHTSVWTTPNPNFRRVVAQVKTGGEVDATLTTILGRY